jgi:hypothetical protein
MLLPYYWSAATIQWQPPLEIKKPGKTRPFDGAVVAYRKCSSAQIKAVKPRLQ